MPTLTDFIAAMPHADRQSFLDAGWKSGSIRRQAIETYGLRLFPLAAEILSEMTGIEVRPTAPGDDIRAFRVRFDPSIVRGYEDEVQKLSELLGVSLFPVADVGNGVAILLVAESGELLLLGYSTPGVYLAGKTFSEGVLAILHGTTMNLLVFENDSDGIFSNPDSELGCPKLLKVPAGGLKHIA